MSKYSVSLSNAVSYCFSYFKCVACMLYFSLELFTCSLSSVTYVTCKELLSPLDEVVLPSKSKVDTK